jgi:hypothetical protein
VPGSALATTGAATDLRVFVTSGNTIHDLNIKATEGTNGQILPVSGFVIDPEDVVQVRQGQNLIITTSTNEPQRIEKVKVVNTAGQFIELVSLTPNQWSLQGFATGVYLLDVIVDIPTSSSLAAYETVLVILEPEQQPLQQTEITKIVNTVKVDVKIIFKDEKKKEKPKDDLRRICTLNPEDPRCPEPKDGDCPPGWGTNEAGQCFPLGKCPDGYHRANDDETGRCVPDKDLKQCEDGSWAHKDDNCPEEEPIICEPGFVDMGDGCVPIEDTILPCAPGERPGAEGCVPIEEAEEEIPEIPEESSEEESEQIEDEVGEEEEVEEESSEEEESSSEEASSAEE